MHFLKDLFQLETLSVVSCHHIDGEGLESISHVSTLATLVLFGCLEIMDNRLLHLGKLSSLKVLDVSGCKRLSGMAFRALAGAPLTTLNASHCSHLTDEGVAAVGHLSKLTRLDLSNCIQITDVGAMALGAVRSLTG